jgi:hypothetical protein
MQSLQLKFTFYFISFQKVFIWENNAKSAPALTTDAYIKK